MKEIGFIILGYLSGSILFSHIASTLLNCGDITSNSCDQNPGAANAFRNGGFWCGFTTLVGDMLKGFLPVWSYLSLAGGEPTGLAFSLLLASPVVGHIFPLYFRFHGGKGIATTFGCLLGLLPEFLPVAILAGCFLFFSCILPIHPHYHRTVLTYLCTEILILFFVKNLAVILGFLWIMLAVEVKLLTSKEEKQGCKVGFLWMR